MNISRLEHYAIETSIKNIFMDDLEWRLASSLPVGSMSKLIMYHKLRAPLTIQFGQVGRVLY